MWLVVVMMVWSGEVNGVPIAPVLSATQTQTETQPEPELETADRILH
jgi:hypothetical protein